MKNLRKLINSKTSPLVIPGVYDAISAKIAQKIGFNAMFQTGYGTSASLLGMPDYGFIGATETLDNARRISNAISVPLIVDVDTGFGDVINVSRTVKSFEQIGVAGVQLEDQTAFETQMAAIQSDSGAAAIQLGIFIMILGIALSLYYLYLRIFTNLSVPGFTATILTIIIFSGVQIFLIGIIGAYIARIFEETKNRPLYVVDEVIDMEKDEK